VFLETLIRCAASALLGIGLRISCWIGARACWRPLSAAVVISSGIALALAGRDVWRIPEHRFGSPHAPCRREAPMARDQ
jgi:hypothetical protein